MPALYWPRHEQGCHAHCTHCAVLTLRQSRHFLLCPRAVSPASLTKETEYAGALTIHSPTAPWPAEQRQMSSLLTSPQGSDTVDSPIFLRKDVDSSYLTVNFIHLEKAKTFSRCFYMCVFQKDLGCWKKTLPRLVSLSCDPDIRMSEEKAPPWLVFTSWSGKVLTVMLTFYFSLT